MSDKRRRDNEKLGRLLEGIIDTSNPDRKRVYKTAFLKGVFTGVGSVLGATIVIAILLWVLSLFEQVPLVGPLFESLQRTIEQ